MAGRRRVTSDGNGGHLVKVERSEWKKVVAAAAIILSTFGYAGKSVVDDVMRSAKNDPVQDIGIQHNADAIKALQIWVETANDTLVRLTTVLEQLEAQIGDNDGR